jgi:hypothetical protein
MGHMQETGSLDKKKRQKTKDGIFSIFFWLKNPALLKNAI